jgi:Flp pilus assembly pilin Flp
MRIRKLKNCSAGATAVEYGVIAGLIALGILGSLVGTRASLNNVFGGAASGIGQTMASHPKPPASANASYWTSKTLVSMTPSNVSSAGGTYKYTYSDGTISTYTVNWNPDGSFNGESISISRNAGGYQPTIDNLTVNALGQPTYISQTIYRDYSSQVSSLAYASGSGTASDWPGSYISYMNDGSVGARCNAGQCYDPTLSQRNTAAQDPLYFRGLVAQM